MCLCFEIITKSSAWRQLTQTEIRISAWYDITGNRNTYLCVIQHYGELKHLSLRDTTLRWTETRISSWYDITANWNLYLYVTRHYSKPKHVSVHDTTLWQTETRISAWYDITANRNTYLCVIRHYGEPKHVSLRDTIYGIVSDGMFSFVYDIQKHNGIHQNKNKLLLVCLFAEKRSVRRSGTSCGRDCQSLKLITK